ncbi:MAG: class I tRNA ligase family protein, partial [Tenericutes bacterium]|nr:class I tRNA ligase family protein [Mycoplasmatota bacterium]
LGNGVNPFDLFQEYGADACRWYLLYVSPVWTPTKFDIDGLKEVQSKFFNTLKNTYTFFEMYANTDKLDLNDFDISYDQLEQIDKWLLSKYNNLVKNVTSEMDKYDLNKSVRLIQDFVSDDLSNWYIRRNRRRFWGSELDNSKKAVYKTTYDVLVGVSKLIAPITPFISEELYRNLTGEVSVHLADYPVCNEDMIDLKLEEKMDLVIELISYARNIREESRIKVRQPIKEVIFEAKYKSVIKEFEDLIKDELNVKNVVWAKDMKDYLIVEYKPNFKETGKIFNNDLSLLSDYLKNISDEDIELLNKGKLKINLNDKEYKIDYNYVLTNIKATEGYTAVMLNYKTVVINTLLTQELINEGLAREIVSKVQNLRKSSGFDIADRITMTYEGPDEIKEAINEFKTYIMDEVLAVSIENDSSFENMKINDYDIKVTIKQINK